MIWKSRTDTTLKELIGTEKIWSGQTQADYNIAKKEIETYLKKNKNKKIWGGRSFNFDPHPTDTTWQSLPRFYFFVPKQTKELNLSETDAPQWSKPLFSTQKEEWVKRVKSIQSEIKNGTIKKAVLSRKSTIKLIKPTQKEQLINHFNENYKNCYLFSISLDKDHTFLGASPEQLFALNNQRLTTEALAGTRPRGKTEKEDKQLENNLINSKKDIDEHDIVVKHVYTHCQKLCKTVQQTPAQILKFSNVQHLYAKFNGNLEKETSPMDIIDSLHPTPAVCGSPSQQAHAIIQKNEPHDRGWYGGVIGWMNHQNAEFAVNIRSGLLRAHDMITYVGVGIVGKSDPLKEWMELNYKAAVFEPSKKVGVL